MAQYHFHQSYVQRSQGSSAMAHAAYIAGDKIADKRTGRTYDYTAKNHIAVSRILAPSGSHSWVYQRDTLWNALEAFEDDLAYKRFRGHQDPLKNQKSLQAREEYINNARTGLKVRGSLPLELTFQQSKEAVETFLKERFVSRGLVVDYAIHWETGNPHFHALATLRRLEGHTFSEAKDRDICTKEGLKISRKVWEEIGNQALEKAGRTERWTCHSYKDLGIEVIPTHHRGWYADYLQNKDLPCRIEQDNEEIRQENIKLFLYKPEELIKIVAQHHMVFTKVDIEKEIFKRVGDDPLLLETLQKKCELWMQEAQQTEDSYLGRDAAENSMFEGRFEDVKTTTVLTYTRMLLSHNASMLHMDSSLQDIVTVGDTVKRDKAYVRLVDKQREERVVTTLEYLLSSESFSIPNDELSHHIQTIETQEALTFSTEQRVAIEHLNKNNQITVLTGRAGTGKTTLLKPLATAYQNAGYRVRGTAFQGKIVDLLSRELSIESYTLDSFKKLFDRIDVHENTLQSRNLHGLALNIARHTSNVSREKDLTHRDVIIMDEANMVSLPHWDMILSRIKKSGAKLIVVQDPAQIKPLFGADIGRIIDEKGAPACLTTVHRQKQAWMREASAAFNSHDLLKGLQAYEEQSRIHFKKDFEAIRYAIVADYVNATVRAPQKSIKIVAFENKHVYDFNQGVQHQLKQRGDLGEAIIIGAQTFYVGDHVVFTKNSFKDVVCLRADLSKTTANRGTVKNGTFGILEAFNGETVKVRLPDGRLMGFNKETYQDIQLGYALTINKAEGETFDEVFGYAASNIKPNQWLILGTRHRHDLNIYVSQEQVLTLGHLAYLAGNSDFRPLIADYTLTPDTQPFFDKVQRYRDMCLVASDHLEDIRTPVSSDTPTLSSSREDAKKTEKALASKASAWEAYETLTDLRKAYALDIFENWEACQTFAYQVGLRKKSVAYHAGVETKSLTPLEIESCEQVGLYRRTTADTGDLWKIIKESSPSVLEQQKHPLYEDYIKQRQARNNAAYTIATHPSLHAPFFKMEKSETEDKRYEPTHTLSEKNPSKTLSAQKTFTYTDQCGQVFDRLVGSMKYVETHANQYIENKREEIFIASLSPEAKKDYDTLKSYRQHAWAFSSLYRKLKEIKSESSETENNSREPITLNLPTTQDASAESASEQKTKQQDVLEAQLQVMAHERDALAHDILLTYERFAPYLDTLKIKQDMLLEHASRGEVGLIVQAYREATTIDVRIKKAEQLKSLMYGVDGKKYNGTYYALVMQHGIDKNRLSFDAGIQSLKNTDITLVELKESYMSLALHRAIHKESTALWKTISASAIEQVQTQQDHVIRTYRVVSEKEYLSSSLIHPERETIEQAVLEEQGLKDVNSTVLRETNQRIFSSLPFSRLEFFEENYQEEVEAAKKALKKGAETDQYTRVLKGGFMSPLQHLYKSHHLLEERHNSYLTLTPDKEDADTWKNLREDKFFFAHMFCTRYEKLIPVLQDYEQVRLRKEALEFKVSELVRRFDDKEQSGTVEDKMKRACDLLTILDAKGPKKSAPPLQSISQHKATPYESTFLDNLNLSDVPLATLRPLVQRQLKAQDVPFNGISLYDALKNTDDEKVNLAQVCPPLEQYIAYNKKCAQILSELTQGASYSYGAQLAAFTSHIIDLQEKLHPHDSLKQNSSRDHHPLKYPVKKCVTQSIAFYKKTEIYPNTFKNEDFLKPGISFDVAMQNKALAIGEARAKAHIKRMKYVDKQLSSFIEKHALKHDASHMPLLTQHFINTIEKGYTFDSLKSEYIYQKAEDHLEEYGTIHPLYSTSRDRNEAALYVWNTNAYSLDDTQPPAVAKLFDDALRFSLSWYVLNGLQNDKLRKENPNIVIEDNNDFPVDVEAVKTFLVSAYTKGTPAIQTRIVDAFEEKKMNTLDYGFGDPPTQNNQQTLSQQTDVTKESEKPSIENHKKVKSTYTPPSKTWHQKKSYTRDTSYEKVNVPELIKLFNEHIDIGALAREIFTKSKSAIGDELKFDEGGIYVNISKRVWNNFSGDGGGSAYGLIKEKQGLTRAKDIFTFGLPHVSGHVRYAIESYVNQDSNYFMSDLKSQAHIKEAQKRAKEQSILDAAAKEKEDQAKRDSIQELYEKSVPLTGTQAQTYLEKQRHILETPSQDIRYLEAHTHFTYKGYVTKVYHGGLLAFARDKKGELAAVQLTPLYKGERSKNKEGEKELKKTYGIQKSSFVTIQDDGRQSIAFLAEGVETALSLKEAGITSSIYAGLGINNLANFNLPYSTVVLCADYDGVDSNTSKLIGKHAKTLEDKGYDVITIWPIREGETKLDFNDILTLFGKETLHQFVKDEVEELPVFKDPVVEKISTAQKELALTQETSIRRHNQLEL